MLPCFGPGLGLGTRLGLERLHLGLALGVCELLFGQRRADGVDGLVHEIQEELAHRTGV